MNFKYLTDVPQAPFGTGRMRENKTGTWKYAEPLYLDKTPPCAHACPAGNDISKCLDLIAKEQWDEAAKLWLHGNPIPSSLGRVCPHPCEGDCNRGSFGGAIAIHSMERALGDYSLKEGMLPECAPDNGKSVAVIGSGPGGLSVAYQLRRAGCRVDIFEKADQAGGWLRLGIPVYRLPREILDSEISRMFAMGIEFHLQTPVKDREHFDKLLDQFDAVVIAVGLHRARPMGVEGEEGPGTWVGTQLLERVCAGERPDLPGPVVVVGGGNTAMDAARSMRRLGHDVNVVYRRTRAEMPAIEEEIKGAEEEGITFHFLTQPVGFIRAGEALNAIRCIRMQLGGLDDSGRRRPIPVPNSEFEMKAGTVIKAIGEAADLTPFPEGIRSSWGIEVQDTLATSDPRVFAVGDVATGMGTVTHAVGDGRRAAVAILRHLAGEGIGSVEESHRLTSRQTVGDVIRVDQLNTAYFSEVPRPLAKMMDPGKRIESFDEIEGGLTPEEAIEEARRCFVCGTCNECFNCLTFCPDVAIARKEPFGFTIDGDHCKGCGICVAECPRNAMLMKEVTK